MYAPFFRVVAALLCSLSCSVWSQEISTAPVPEPQNAIWFEQRVGHVVVDVQQQGGRAEAALSYVFYFAAIGPRPATATKDYGGCLKEAVKAAGKAFIDALNSEAQLFVPSAEPIYSDNQITRTQNALVTARGEYKKSVIANCTSIEQADPLRKYIDGTRLGLVKRECTAALCPDLDVPERADETGAISEGERRERVFEAMYYWAAKRGFDTTLNRVLVLEFSDNGGLAPKVVETRPGVGWPTRLPPDQTQKLFEAGVARLVKNPQLPPLSSVVAAQLLLPRPTVLRTAFAFRDPQDAYTLGVDSAELKLNSLQDEVARIRLTECKVYHGLQDVAAVGRCAGYQIDNKAMLECLNDGPCMPQLAATADAGALLQSARRRISDLGLDAFVPRPYSEAVGSFGAMVDTYKACTANEDANAAAACLARKSVPPEIAKQANCLLENAGASRITCLAPDGASGRALKQLQKCVERNSKGCAVDAVLPPEWACVSGAQSVSDLNCLAGNVGGDVGKVAQCLKQETDTAARIICIGGDNVPAPVQKVVACYTSSTSEASLAACAIGTALPPEQAAVVKCAAESGGDPMATGVCVVSPLLHLNPGQQIILQCAASSGGVPVTAAACIAGRFTLIELQGCKSADFGQSGCFGDGNEFQKLAKAITGSTVSKNSVVGQIMVAHIEVANSAIGGVGHALNEISKGGKQTAEGFDHELEKARTNPVGLIVDAPGNVVRETFKGVENLAKAVTANWDIKL
ncbi:hypothetical protein [Paraburkholderia xenovorans]